MKNTLFLNIVSTRRYKHPFLSFWRKRVLCQLSLALLIPIPPNHLVCVVLGFGQHTLGKCSTTDYTSSCNLILICFADSGIGTPSLEGRRERREEEEGGRASYWENREKQWFNYAAEAALWERGIMAMDTKHS